MYFHKKYKKIYITRQLLACSDVPSFLPLPICPSHLQSQRSRSYMLKNPCIPLERSNKSFHKHYVGCIPQHCSSQHCSNTVPMTVTSPSTISVASFGIAIIAIEMLQSLHLIKSLNVCHNWAQSLGKDACVILQCLTTPKSKNIVQVHEHHWNKDLFTKYM